MNLNLRMLIMFQIPGVLAGEICFLLEPQKAVCISSIEWVRFTDSHEYNLDTISLRS